MAQTKKSTSRTRPPARSPEDRENQMIALAMDKVEERMMTGKASSQEYIHFLRLATTKSQLELEKVRHENALLEAKTAAIEASKRTEEMYANAIKAMRTYMGAGDEPDDPNQVVLGVD